MVTNVKTITCATLILCGSAAGQDNGIENLAPDNSFVVVSVRNAAESLGHLKSTRLWDLWNTEEIADLRGSLMEDFQAGMQDFFAELDLNHEDIAWPEGALGFALYSVTDPELGQPTLATLTVADYGENADQQLELIEAIVQRGEEEGEIEVEEREILGYSVTSVTGIIEEDEPAPAEDEMGMPMMPGAGMLEDVGQAIADGFKTMHVVRVGSQFLYGNDLPSLTAAIEALENEPVQSVRDNETFQRVRDRLDREADGYAMLLTGGLSQMMSQIMSQQQAAQGGMNPMAMVVPTLKAVFGDVHAFGVDFRIAGETGMLEQNMTIYMPNGKRGLTELVDQAGARSDLPPFAGADAISFSAVSVQMNEFGDVFNNILNSTMLGMAVAQQRQQVDEFVEQIVATVGDEAFTLTTMRRPMTPESIGNVVAIRLRDEQGFEDFLVETAEGQLEPRDFLGRRIYDMDMGGMAMGMPGGGGTISMGIGGGFLVIGQTTGVEDAIRSLSDEDSAALGTREGYQRAVAALSGGPVVGWGYSETVDALEVQAVSQKQAAMQQIEFLRDFDPDMAREMEADIEEQFAWIDMIDFDLLRQYIGPNAWEMTVDDEGFTVRSVTLEARGE